MPPKTRRIKGSGVQVEGLAELATALKSIGPELAKELRVANKEAATVAKEGASHRATSLGGVAAKSAPALKVAAGAKSAGLALSATGAYPFALGAEFGSLAYRQFKEWRGSGDDAGYFMWPAIRDDADKIIEPYQEVVDRIIRKAFPQ